MHPHHPINPTDTSKVVNQAGWAKGTLATGSWCDGVELFVGPQLLEGDIATGENEVTPDRADLDHTLKFAET